MPSASATPTASPLDTRRLPFLDWVRVLAFGLLVFYHVGMYYVSWDWHIKSPHAGTWLEPWMRLSSPWRMDLLFLVSGAATAYMLLRGGASTALLAQRARRLLLPLVCGMLVVVPPQSWVEVVHKLAYTGSYADFMRLYLGAYGGFCFAPGKCLVLPTWNHLWFLPYLFVYTVLAWAALRAWPALADRMARRLPDLLAGPGLVLVPVAFLVLTRVLLRDRFPVTHALVDDWFAHSQFLAMFVLGLLLARAPALWPRMAQLRWTALLLALASWALMVVDPVLAGSGSTFLPFGGHTPQQLLRPLFFSLQQWCAIVAALGFAHRHLTHASALLRTLTVAVFPLYILHQTAIVVLAYWLAPSQLPLAAEAGLLVVGGFGAGLAVFVGLQRLRWLGWARPWFGLAPLPRAKAGVDATHGALTT